MNTWTTSLIEKVNEVVSGGTAGAGTLIEWGIGWIVEFVLAFWILGLVVYGVYRFINR